TPSNYVSLASRPIAGRLLLGAVTFWIVGIARRPSSCRQPGCLWLNEGPAHARSGSRSLQIERPGDWILAQQAVMRLFRRTAWMRQWLDPIAMALAAVAVVVAVGCPARQVSRRTPQREAPRPRPAAPPAAAHASAAPLLSSLVIAQARPAAQA